MILFLLGINGTPKKFFYISYYFKESSFHRFSFLSNLPNSEMLFRSLTKLYNTIRDNALHGFRFTRNSLFLCRNSPKMIKAKNIHKYFDKLHVLKGVNLHIQKGEIVSIVGASGAGKTTLLQIMGTLDKPSFEKNTELVVNGEDVLKMNDKALSKFRNLQLGFIFQFHQLLPEFTAIENVCIPAFIAGKDKKETEAEAKRLLDYLGLSHRYDHKPGELSGGEQQRVAVARALINKPAIIFADEPSGNLDTHSAENLHQLFFKLRDEFGQTFVIVTHNEELANMADRKLVMVDGLIS